MVKSPWSNNKRLLNNISYSTLSPVAMLVDPFWLTNQNWTNGPTALLATKVECSFVQER